MQLYLIERTDPIGYDAYCGAVVCAPDIATARRINPRDGRLMGRGKWDNSNGTWVDSVRKVTATYLGDTGNGAPQGVILASFNAG